MEISNEKMKKMLYWLSCYRIKLQNSDYPADKFRYQEIEAELLDLMSKQENEETK